MDFQWVILWNWTKKTRIIIIGAILKIVEVNIGVGAEIGSIGGTYSVGKNSFSAKGAYGYGFSLNTDW